MAQGGDGGRHSPGRDGAIVVIDTISGFFAARTGAPAVSLKCLEGRIGRIPAVPKCAQEWQDSTLSRHSSIAPDVEQSCRLAVAANDSADSCLSASKCMQQKAGTNSCIIISPSTFARRGASGGSQARNSQSQFCSTELQLRKLLAPREGLVHIYFGGTCNPSIDRIILTIWTTPARSAREASRCARL